MGEGHRGERGQFQDSRLNPIEMPTEIRNYAREQLVSTGIRRSRVSRECANYSDMPLCFHMSGNSFSGSNLIFGSWKVFPSGSLHASLAHANRNFHFSQAC